MLIFGDTRAKARRSRRFFCRILPERPEALSRHFVFSVLWACLDTLPMDDKEMKDPSVSVTPHPGGQLVFDVIVRDARGKAGIGSQLTPPKPTDGQSAAPSLRGAWRP